MAYLKTLAIISFLYAYVWESAQELIRLALLIVIMEQRHAQLLNARFTILHGMDDLIILTASIEKAAKLPCDFLGMKLKEVF